MPGLSWSKQEIRLLRKLVAEEHTALSIVETGYFSGEHGSRKRTVDAVSQQMRRLRLANPTRSERARKARARVEQFERECGATFRLYLRERGARDPIWITMRHWGVSYTYVRRQLRLLGINRTWRESIALPLSKYNSREYRAALSQRIRKQAASRRGVRLRKLEELRLQELHRNPLPQTRVCLHCHKPYPLDTRFFRGKEDRRGRVFYMWCCIPCYPQAKAAAQAAQHPNLRVLFGIRKIEALSAALFREGHEAPTRKCIRCQRVFPLTKQFWGWSYSSAKRICYDHRCRICKAADRRFRHAKFEHLSV